MIQCCRNAKQLIFTRECFDVVRGSIIIDFNVKISTFGESYSNFRGVVNSFPQVKIGKFKRLLSLNLNAYEYLYNINVMYSNIH